MRNKTLPRLQGVGHPFLMLVHPTSRSKCFPNKLFGSLNQVNLAEARQPEHARALLDRANAQLFFYKRSLNWTWLGG